MSVPVIPSNGRSHYSIHGIVYRAVQNGTLKKPDCCSKCGARPFNNRGNLNIHAHHEDYEKPLEVIWLCPPCHHARHRELGWGLGGQTTALIRKGRTKEEYQKLHDARFRAEYPELAYLCPEE